jgi:hypothetical protein
VTVNPVERLERRRRRRRQAVTFWAIRGALAIVVFGLGVALGQALHDNPKPGQTITLERTLRLPTTGKPGSTVFP